MITKTTLALLAYLCVAGFIADAQSCNSTTPCAGNQVCGMPTYCNIGYCGCSSSGMVFNGTTCITPASISINGSCTIEQDCKGLYTTCSSGKCACSSATYTAKADGSDCVVPPLNSTCTATGYGCGTYASCSSSGLCPCWTGQYTGGYTPVGGSNNVDCRPMKVGDTCSNVTDCPSNTASRACANANCDSGAYQCNSGYHWVTSETFSFSSSNFAGGCVPNNVTASVAVGQPCSDSQVGGSTYMLCSSGLTCVPCGSSYTCQNVNTPPPTTKGPNGGAANVRLDMMAVVSMLALALLRFAA